MKVLLRVISLIVLVIGIYLFVIGDTGFGVIAVIVALILFPTKGSRSHGKKGSQAVSGSHTYYDHDDDDDDRDEEYDHDNDGGDSSDSGDSGGGSDD